MIIAIANEKGGVGKTTSTICIGGILALTAPCLLIDFDSQANLTTALGIELDKEQPTINDVINDEASLAEATIPTGIDGLDLVPANSALSRFTIRPDKSHFILLRERLARFPTHHSHILIDCPPFLGPLTANALIASHAVLIPVQCQYLALKGLSSFLNTIENVQKNLNPNLRILGIIPTMGEKTVMCRDVCTSLQKNMNARRVHIFPIVPKSVKFAESNVAGKPIHLYAPNETQLAHSYNEIAKTIFNLKKKP